MKLREVMRRVINFSTMGVDMSKLFTPVIMVFFLETFQVDFNHKGYCGKEDDKSVLGHLCQAESGSGYSGY